MADEQNQGDMTGIMLGLVEFNGEPGVGIRVSSGNVIVFPIEYMVGVYDQLGEILYKAGALDEDEDEGEESEGLLQ